MRLQKAKKIMLMRLKVPPAINQFNCAIDKNQAAHVLKLCKKYMPETRAQDFDACEKFTAGSGSVAFEVRHVGSFKK